MPGTTSLTINNEDLSLSLFDQVKELRAMKDHPYKLLEDLLANVDKVDGGERVIVRWDVDDHSVATRVQTGYEDVTNFAQPTLQPGNQAWGITVQPVYISVVDEKKNSGRAQILKVLEERVKNVERHIRRQYQKWILQGSVSGAIGFDDFLMINGADSTTGLLEATATGTNTLHGVAKTSYPPTTHEQFHNFFSDCAGDASANLLPALYGAMVDAEVKEGEPNASESFWYLSRLAANNLKNTIRPFEQYVADGDTNDGNRVSHHMYGGIKMRVTTELPNAGSASTTNPWSALRINWKQGIRFRSMSDWTLDWTDFMDLPGTVGVRYALNRLWGQLICQQPGLNSVVVDAEVL